MKTEDKIPFSDRNIKPDDELLEALNGSNFVHWKNFLSEILAYDSSASGDWRYYNDGKQWLFKMENRKRTIFWASYHEGAMMVTFYFTDKATDLLRTGGVSVYIIDKFLTERKFGSLKPISIELRSEEDVHNALGVAIVRIKAR